MRINPQLREEITADVVIVGSGLSGLVAAHELAKAGITDVVLIDSRDRVGGRIHDSERENGGILQGGAEFTGEFQHAMLRLLAELELETEKLPRVEGDLVRFENGNRFTEAWPFANDEETGAAYAELYEKLGAMVAEIPNGQPWNAPNAVEWDAITFGEWLRRECKNPVACEAVTLDLAYDPDQVSLLSLVWWISKYGSIEGMDAFDMRVVGGMSRLVETLLNRVHATVYLESPVTQISCTASGVLVTTAQGSVSAKNVVVAIDTGSVRAISFDPPLPEARATLIEKWDGFHDCKAYFVYDRPFWRDAGLNGTMRGLSPIEFGMDVSPADGSEGILVTRRPLTKERWEATAICDEKFDDVVCNDEKFFQVGVEQMVQYFGEEARNVKEFHYFDWNDDEWSGGCGLNRLAPGVLTSVGSSLREHVGPIVWAGSDVGFEDTLSGAVEAGELAAQHIISSISAQ